MQHPCTHAINSLVFEDKMDCAKGYTTAFGYQGCTSEVASYCAEFSPIDKFDCVTCSTMACEACNMRGVRV